MSGEEMRRGRRPDERNMRVAEHSAGRKYAPSSNGNRRTQQKRYETFYYLSLPKSNES
jgi:hypothetical protein